MLFVFGTAYFSDVYQKQGISYLKIPADVFNDFSVHSPQPTCSVTSSLVSLRSLSKKLGFSSAELNLE